MTASLAPGYYWAKSRYAEDGAGWIVVRVEDLFLHTTPCFIAGDEQEYSLTDFIFIEPALVPPNPPHDVEP